MRPTPALALATTAALLLTACTAGSDDAPEQVTTSPGAPTPTDAATDAVPDDEAPADAADDLAPATEECVVGTWQLDLTAMQDDLRRMVGGTGDVEVEVTGTSTYELAADGGFRATVDSSSAMALSVAGSNLTSTSVASGDLTGAWSLDGDVLVISDVDSGDLTVSTTATMDGEQIDVPAGTAGDAIGVLPPTSSTASCGADRMRLVMPVVQDEDAEPVNVTYTLRR